MIQSFSAGMERAKKIARLRSRTTNPVGQVIDKTLLRTFREECQIILSMTEPNPDARPSAHHLLNNDPFVRQYIGSIPGLRHRKSDGFLSSPPYATRPLKKARSQHGQHQRSYSDPTSVRCRNDVHRISPNIRHSFPPHFPMDPPATFTYDMQDVKDCVDGPTHPLPQPTMMRDDGSQSLPISSTGQPSFVVDRGSADYQDMSKEALIAMMKQKDIIINQLKRSSGDSHEMAQD